MTSVEQNLLFKEMSFEMTKDILTFAEDPGKAVPKMLEEIRELTGAKIVALYKCSEGPARKSQIEHKLVKVNPKRKTNLLTQDLIESLIDLVHSQKKLVVISEKNHIEEYKKLSKQGFDLSLALPLKINSVLYGGFLILGLPTQTNLDLIIQGLQALTSILALIFRYSVLYTNMEELVIERTRSLKESEKKFRNYVETSQDLIWECDAKGRFIYLNPAWEQVTGYKLSEMLGKPFTAFTLKEEAEKISTEFARHLKGGFVKGFPSTYISKTGSKIHLIFNAIPLYDSSKNIIGTQGSAFDITERVLTEAALEASEKKFKQLTDNSLAGIYIVLNQKMKYCKRRFAEIWGYENPEEIIGLDIQKLVDVASISQVEEEIEQRITGDIDISRYEAKCVKKSGEIFDVEVLGSSIIFEGQRAAQGMAVDITARKQAEEELKKYRNNLQKLVKERTAELENKTTILEESQKAALLLLEDVNEARNELEESNRQLVYANTELESFSYSVSHDLRAPLRAIGGFTRILMQDYVDQLDSEGKRLGSIIQENTRKMGQLIDDLLSFSRMGRSSMNISEINMQNMVAALYHEATSEEDRQRIEFSISDLPKAKGDASMIRQVWTNLISNALKFSAFRKQAIISVSFQAEKDRVIYCVKDNGAGFDMKYKEKLFGVFQRLHSEDEFKGTGVGLALVQRIIHRHGGQVWAEAKVDAGAAFYFSLPEKGGFDKS